MREILFRGKRLSDGGWSYGNLRIGNTGVAIIVPNDTPLGKYGKVNPETVGQFTGMTDENGVRIFEGDIVSFTRVNALGWNTQRIGEVRYYDELPIFYIMATTGDAWDWVVCENIKVIGNIFDDPELLEGDVSDETD